MVNTNRLQMIFTNELVLIGIGNETTVDKNKHFLKYKAPKMEKFSVRFKNSKGPNHDQ